MTWLRERSTVYTLRDDGCNESWATFNHNRFNTARSEAAAEHARASMNACEAAGIEDPETTVPEMVKALETALTMARELEDDEAAWAGRPNTWTGDLEQIEAVYAKVKGGE